MSDSYVGAIALIRQFVDEQCLWLFRREPNAPLRMIQAARLEKESYREVIEREVAWVLQLERGKDYIVSRVPRAHYQGVIEEGDHAAYYVIELYIVDLFGKRARAHLNQDPDNQWLSTAELLTADAETISIDPIQRRLLHLTEAIGPESV